MNTLLTVKEFEEECRKSDQYLSKLLEEDRQAVEMPRMYFNGHDLVPLKRITMELPEDEAEAFKNMYK